MMAELQFVYRNEYYCELDPIVSCSAAGRSPHCMQCYTAAAKDIGCSEYYDGNNNPRVIPFGDCKHAKIKYAYKGVSVKKYDICKSMDDPWNPHLECMEVTVGGITYECEKVILNGECIYNEWDDDGAGKQGGAAEQ